MTAERHDLEPARVAAAELRKLHHHHVRRTAARAADGGGDRLRIVPEPLGEILRALQRRVAGTAIAFGSFAITASGVAPKDRACCVRECGW